MRCLVYTEMALVGVDRSRLVWIGWCVTGCVVKCLGSIETALVGVDRAKQCRLVSRCIVTCLGCIDTSLEGVDRARLVTIGRQVF